MENDHVRRIRIGRRLLRELTLDSLGYERTIWNVEGHSTMIPTCSEESRKSKNCTEIVPLGAGQRNPQDLEAVFGAV